jgi:hypothetical protein
VSLLQAKAKVNVGFWGGITPANAHNDEVLWGMLKAGALGFKSFLAPSGINDFENVSRSDVAGAMHFLLSKGAPFFVHAELVTDVEQTEVRNLDQQAFKVEFGLGFLGVGPEGQFFVHAELVTDMGQTEVRLEPSTLAIRGLGFDLFIDFWAGFIQFRVVTWLWLCTCL